MKRNKYNTEDKETSYWLSYSDMMAALLLIFILIISVTILDAQKRFDDDANELKRKEQTLEEQAETLEEQEKTIQKQQKKIDQIIGVRSELIEALSEEFTNTDLRVSVDEQTGAITFDSSVLFDSNEYEVKKSGKKFLEQFLPRYFKVLFRKKFFQYISEVIIEGHTDTDGGYMYNLELSQKRALAVAKYCLSPEEKVLSKKQIKKLRPIVTANGRSYSNPIYIEKDHTVDKAASRRVEVMFRLKDEEMVNEMNKILNGD